MIKLIVGNKGSGKTKDMIEKINETLKDAKGNIICIEKGMKLTYDLNHSVRLVDMDKYDVDSFEKFAGFVSGILAGNYDIREIFVDGILKVGGKNLEEFGTMVEKIEKIVDDAEANLTFTVSIDKESIPTSLEKYMA